MVDLSRDSNGRTRARLLDLVPGRSGQVYKAWLRQRGKTFRDNVQVATLDPFHGYKNAIDDQLEDARAVLDAFHVVKLATGVVDQVRRRVQQDIHGHRGRKDDPLYRIRNILRAGAENLTDRQRERLTRAWAADERHLEVELAYQCAQLVRSVYHQDTLAEGRAVAERVLVSFTTGPIPEVARLGRTLKQWRTEFLGYFDTAGASNGGTEAIIIWSPPQAVLDVTDGVFSLRRRHVIWSLSPTVPTDLPWSWLAFRLSICTARPRRRHVSDADPLLEQSCPPGAPDNDQRPHRAPSPRRPRFPQPSQLPAPHAPHRWRTGPTTPHSTLKSPLTCRNPHAGVADPMPVHRPHSVERADILFVWGRVNQAGHVVS